MRRALPSILAAATVLALAGCGGDGGPGPTAGSTSKEAPITSDGPPPSGATSTGSSTSGSSTSGASTSGASDNSSPASTTSSSSAAPSSTSTDTGKPFDADEFTSRLETAVDANPSVRIEVAVGPEGQPSATASGVQDLADDALEMQVSVGGQEMTYRLVDGQYYLKQEPKWVPVTKDSTNPLIKQALSQTELLSMRRQLDAFIAGVEAAGDKGTEEVDGVSTTHYTATVDTDKALKELGLPKTAGSPESAIYDVWLDEDDLIRKMSFTQNGAQATMTASDWGEPVSITKPKDSELAQVR
ncbi:LppX_LprAFG lipoprotein [Janibacter anophelis]|uniref:LppX_LprAFG lipoprotein n=1 Tax=Janibacter anophelis TaxID=319054 RepID=UPI000DEEB72A|nr:LppX_LprAFG lipoprotein [Janibacter anophelis]